MNRLLLYMLVNGTTIGGCPLVCVPLCGFLTSSVVKDSVLPRRYVRGDGAWPPSTSHIFWKHGWGETDTEPRILL